jgi:hypothetical protein
MASDR